MSFHRWIVSTGRGAHRLHLYDYNWRARLWESVEGTVCACRLPEWVWLVPLGKPQRDPEDGILNNSVASKVWDVEQWIGRRASEAQERCAVGVVDITEAALLELAPDLAFLFADDDAA